VSRATTIPKASGKWSTSSPAKASGAIKRPVTIKKLGMEQGFPKELQLDPCRIVLVRAVDRQSRQERADNPREIYEIGDRACHRHDAQHQQEMGLLVTPHLALNAQAPARLSPIRINGTKTAISMSWMASPSGAKPVA
jgi:hypothetical protein